MHALIRPIRLLGLDPRLRVTGWGVIEAEGDRRCHLADGVNAANRAHHRATRLVWQRKAGSG